MAQEWRSRCGETCFPIREGQVLMAVLTCLRSKYVKPTRVIGLPLALRNSSGAGASHCKPSANIGSGLLPERQGSLLSPFTKDTECRCWLQGYCGQQKTGQFR